jgi:hypothetical protein
MRRFWSHVNRRTDSECWLWTGYIATHGYGMFSIGPCQIRAHRFSWLTSRGDIGKGLTVCHNCDTPACVNPGHLRLDTHAGNIHESVRKGRKQAWGLQKLNAEQVQDIRFRVACGQLQKDVAAVFSISRNHVSTIVHRRSWAHLD